MDDDDGWIFYGHGSTHDLRDHDEPRTRPRLDGLRSVSEAANPRVLSRGPEPDEAREPNA